MQENVSLPGPDSYFAKTHYVVFVLVEPEIESGEKIPVFFLEWKWEISASKLPSGLFITSPPSLFPPSPVTNKEISGIPLWDVPKSYPEFSFSFPHWKRKMPKEGAAFPWKEK